MLEGSSGGEVESLLELLYESPGVKGIEKVNVSGGSGKDLEGKVSRCNIGLGGFLVGVSSVTEGELLDTLSGVSLTEELGDGAIVVGSVLESLQGVELAGSLGDLSLLELLKEVRVVLGVGKDGDARVVLCGGTEEGDSTDVNLLDGLGDGDIDLSDGVLEGVQVADDVVDLVDVLLSKVLLVGLEVTGEDTFVQVSTIARARVVTREAHQRGQRGGGS